MKALYLNPPEPAKVMLDGQGLRVRVRGEADRLFPLIRLSRIMVTGQVDWATDALLACGRAGIPVNFVRRDGTICASVSGDNQRPNWLQLQTLFSDFLALPDGLERYRNWVCLRRLQALRQGANQVRGRAPLASEAALRTHLQQQAWKYACRAGCRRLDTQVYSLIRIQIARQLQELQIDADAVDLLLNDINLIGDLADIIWWTQQLAKLSWVRKLYRRQRRQHAGLARLDWQHSIGFVETRREILDKRTTFLLRELFEFAGDRVKNHGFG